MMSFTETDRRKRSKLLGQAAFEALTANLETTLAQSTEPVQMSPGHVQRVQKIFRSYILRRRRKIIAAIVAATLLLGGCTFGYEIFKEEIGSFTETHFQNEIDIIHHNAGNNSPQIMECYGLTYVPDGFFIKKEFIDYGNVDYVFRNEHGQTIRFMQSINRGSIGIDNEGQNSELFNYKEYEIYYRKANDNGYVFHWVDGCYMITVLATFELSKDELYQIIDGIRITMTMEEYEKIQASIIKPGRR